MKKPRSDWAHDTYMTDVPNITVFEPEDDDDRWTGLYDANGDRIVYRKPPIGFIDFDLLRAIRGEEE